MYAEIKNDYTYGPAVEEGSTNDYEDLFAATTIDGWKTGDDNEDGTVIATVVMTKHGDIVTVWHDNGARFNPNVCYMIDDAKKRLRELCEEFTTA